MNSWRIIAVIGYLALGSGAASQEPPKVTTVYAAKLISGVRLTQDNVGKYLNKTVTLELTVNGTTSNGLLLTLHACANSNAAENVMVTLTKQCQDGLIKKGIESPKTHFLGKVIRVTGKLMFVAQRPSIDMYNAALIVEVPKK